MNQRQASCMKLKVQYLTNVNKLGKAFKRHNFSVWSCHLVNAQVARLFVERCQMSLSKFVFLAIN